MYKSSKETSKAKTKRIASNTVVLFVRMLVLTIVNLYAVRVVVNGLGNEDYGIYNTVAGVVMMSTFLSSVLALAIQRYYSIAIGKGDRQSLREIFSISINIVLAVSLLLIIIFETAGLWFLHNKLIIPLDRLAAAQWAYQCGLLAFLCSFAQIPFSAAMFAHEEMGIYALVSTIECLMKLAAALLVGHILADNLVVYSSGLTVTAVIILLVYTIIGSRRYEECHYRRPRKSALYKSILAFSGWALFGSVASVCITQGNTVLLNMFFGPIIIAAFAIALQINNAFNTLCNNIVLAFRPAMIKAYAERNFTYLNQMFSASNKFLLYILIAIALPLIVGMREILLLWLGDNVTDDTVLFCRLMIVYTVCMSMNNPVTIIMHATGKIMQYSLPVDGVTLLCLPVTWLLFYIGMPSWSVFVSMIGVCVVAHILRLLCLHHYYPLFSLLLYFKGLVVPAAMICVVATALTYCAYCGIGSNAAGLAVSFVAATGSTLALAYCGGLNKPERNLVNSMAKGVCRKWMS